MTSKTTTSRSTRPRSLPVKLKPALRIAEARTLHAQLNKALGAGRPVVLDGSRVERTDTASLQLLCAFFQSSRTAGVKVRWKKPAAALREDAEVLGIAALLHLPAGIDGRRKF